MNFNAPNPEVYRRAAEMVSYTGYCELLVSTYSCMAIEQAMEELGILGRGQRDMYLAQYQAMFGPYKNPRVAVEAFECIYAYFDSVTDGHPFWNKGRRPETQDARVIALLLMADICEQGI